MPKINNNNNNLEIKTRQYLNERYATDSYYSYKCTSHWKTRRTLEKFRFKVLASLGIVTYLSLATAKLVYKYNGQLSLSKHSSRKHENYYSTEDDPPGIAWLLSFPNSGTSYTLQLVHRVTNASIASNYNEGKGYRHYGKLAYTVPVSSKYENGPNRQHIRHALPKGYIITKTHCGRSITDTLDSFRDDCRRVETVVDSEIDGTPHAINVLYNTSIIGKAVHLMRDPFDNLVSRFHLRCNQENRKGNDDWYSRDRRGFREFCRSLDTTTFRKNKQYLTSVITPAVLNVPCHTDLYKYVLWHNHAFAMTRGLDIPTRLLYYEDYRDGYNETLDALLEFLEVQRVKFKVPIYHWSNYSTYFTTRERRLAFGWMKSIASNETWKHLMERYLL